MPDMGPETYIRFMSYHPVIDDLPVVYRVHIIVPGYLGESVVPAVYRRVVRLHSAETADRPAGLYLVVEVLLGVFACLVMMGADCRLLCFEIQPARGIDRGENA